MPTRTPTPEPTPYNIQGNARPFINLGSDQFTARTELRHGSTQDRMVIENRRLGSVMNMDYDQVAEAIALMMRFSTMMPDSSADPVEVIEEELAEAFE